MFFCDFCGNTFKKKNIYQQHVNECKAKDVNFSCKKCGFQTEKFTLIETHRENCVGKFKGDLSEKIHEMEMEKISSEEKIKKFEAIIEDLMEKNEHLRFEIKMEKFQNKILKHFIKKTTNIDMDEMYVEKDDGVHIYDVDANTVNIFLHEVSELSDKTTKEKREEKKIKKLLVSNKAPVKSVYKTVKNKVKLEGENIDEKEQKIQKTDQELEKIKDENLEYKKEDILKKINDIFDDIKKNRVCKKLLDEMRKIREFLLGHLNIGEYIGYLSKQVKDLENLFIKKKYDKKKISTNISYTLSPLDMRLLFFISAEKYYNIYLEVDEIQRYEKCLKLSVPKQFPKVYTVFSYANIYSRFENYGVALFTYSFLLKLSLKNPYPFSDIIFLNFDDEKEDPFRFYILEKIKANGERCWKMEIRLYEFSKTICLHMRDYCIKLFRKIYLDVFLDNVYRENYAEDIAIFQQEGVQLLENIINLSKHKKCCEIIQKIVIKFCTIKPTELDKFNLTGDDKIQKRQFSQEQDNDEDIIESIMMVFDKISEEQARKILQDFKGKNYKS